MPSPNKRDQQSVDYIATGFIQTMYFDLLFNYIGGSVEQVIIVPDAPANWESESCKLIPYVRYEYTQVCKNNPETSRSPMTRINQARKKVRLFASAAENKGTVLRVIKNTIVVKLQPKVEAIYEVTSYYLEESHGSLTSDPIASERKTREFPPDVKQKRKAASNTNDSRSNGRRAK